MVDKTNKDVKNTNTDDEISITDAEITVEQPKYSYAFEVNGDFPRAVIEALMAATTMITGLRGHVEQKSKDVFQIYVEGYKDKLDTIKNFLLNNSDLVRYKANVVLKGIREITDFTSDAFKVALEPIENGPSSAGTSKKEKPAKKEKSTK